MTGSLISSPACILNPELPIACNSLIKRDKKAGNKIKNFEAVQGRLRSQNPGTIRKATEFIKAISCLWYFRVPNQTLKSP